MISGTGTHAIKEFVPSDLELLIVQPNSFCNINCSYCYLPDRGVSSQMQAQVLDATVQRLREHDHISSSLSVVWHAGEPLVVPIKWYDAALHKFENAALDRGFELVSSIQTNGTLITDAWAEFFRSRGVQVGLSIDGPDFIHDRHRVDRRGRGTLSRAIAGLKLLQLHGVDFYNICVVTADTLSYPDELFTFFRDHKIWNIGMNFAEVEGVNLQSGVLELEREDDVRRFLHRFTELVCEDIASPWDWRERRGFLDCAAAPPDFRLSQNSAPGAIISVNAQGHFSTFSPELLGHLVDGRQFSPWNVLQDRFGAMFSDARFGHFADLIRKGVDECMSSCDYASICGGGSPSNKWFEHHRLDVSETRSCRVSLQAMADALLARELRARNPV